MKDKDSRSLHAKDLKGLLAGETNAPKTQLCPCPKLQESCTSLSLTRGPVSPGGPVTHRAFQFGLRVKHAPFTVLVLRPP